MSEVWAQAQLLLEANRAEEARRRLAAHLSTEPGDALALGLMAQAQAGVGDLAAAGQAIERAVGLAPESDWLFRIASMIHSSRGETEQAAAAARQAVRLNPETWHGHAQLACTAAQSRSTRDEALAAAQRAVQLAPLEADTHYAMGLASLATRQRAQAETAFREALRLNPSHTGALHELAVVASRRGRYSEAASGFADAARQEPTWDVARQNIDQVAATVMQRTHLALWVASFLLGRTLLGLRSGGEALPPGWRLTIIALLLTVLLGVAWGWTRLFRGTSAAALRYAKSLPRRDRWAGLWLGCLVTAYLCLVVTVVAPVSVGLIAIGISTVALLIGCLASWVRLAAFRRRRKA